MGKKYILLSLDDKRLKAIAEILGNKTSGSIMDILTDVKEASEQDISQKLKIPISTIEYNVKKMAGAGLLEESKNFFWSKKGKRIRMYRLSNKSIVISPAVRKIVPEAKGVIPLAIIAGIAAVGIKVYFENKMQVAQDTALLYATSAAEKTTETAEIINTGDYWMWFMAGAAFMIVLMIIKLALYDTMINKKGSAIQ